MVALPLNLEQVKHIVEQLPARERAQLRATLTTRAPHLQRRPINPLAVEEMLAFLAAGPGPQALAAFQISASAQRELDEFLDKNREGEISEIDLEALDAVVDMLGLFNLLKARAKRGLTHNP